MTNGFRGVATACLLALAAPGTIAADADADIKVSLDYELSVHFDEAMQTWGEDRPVGIRTQPALPLRCRWDDDTTLACALENGARAPGATRYRVDLPAFVTQDGRRVPARRVAVESRRPRLSTSPWQLEWTAGRPVLRLDASPSVDGDAVRAVLAVEIAGRPVPFDLVTRTPAYARAEPAFDVVLPGPLPADAALVYRVRPGLRSAEGPLPGTQDEVLLRARIGLPARLEDVECDRGGRATHAPGGAGAEAVVARCVPGGFALGFSTELDDAARRRIVAGLPSGVRLVRASTRQRIASQGPGAEAREPGTLLHLALDAPRTEVRIDLPADLRDAAGRPVAPARVVVATGDHPPALEAAHGELLIADPHAGLPVTAVNAAAGTAVARWSLGRGQAEGEFAVPTGPLNAPVPVDDAPTRAALAQGAWTRWVAGGGVLDMAAPQFDVATVVGTDEVLAWVHDWSGTPVRDAGVELLLASPNAPAAVYARARTDAEGVARLRLPAGTVLDDAQRRRLWFVRAQSRGRLAVLPLGPSRYSLDLGDAPTPRAWGVTDRPLYRAGDTVRYRLWSRDERGDSLAMRDAAPVTLHLENWDEAKPIRSWTATPDGDGWSGEVVIPEHAVDGTHCIVPERGDRWRAWGACFFVGTYRAQDLWAEAKAQDALLRPGDRFVFDVSGGYYSGGPASGVAVQRVTTMLTGLPLDEAYPRYAAFTFVDVMTESGRDGLPLRDAPRTARTDVDGRARIEMPLEFVLRGDDTGPPAFGELRATADLGLDAREATTSSAARTRYARFDAYVGLRLEPRWLDADDRVLAEAVVIDAEGRALPGREVEVEIGFQAGHEDDAPVEPVGSCRLRTGALLPCDFPRARSGRYRLVARSGDAAPATLEQYVWSGDAETTRPPAPALELDGGPARAGAPLRVLLRNAVPGSPVLFVVHRGSRILGHARRVATRAVDTYEIVLPEGAFGRTGITAYLRDPTGGGVDGALRRPARITTAGTGFEAQRPARAPVALAFDRARAAPGETVALTLRNDDRIPRDVTLAVMDDALRALAADWLDFSDPYGEAWLGGLVSRYSTDHAQLPLRSFGDWNDEAWRAGLPTRVPATTSAPDAPPPPAPPAPPAQAAMADAYAGDLDRVQVTGSRIRAVEVWGEGAGRADGAAFVTGRTSTRTPGAPGRPEVPRATGATAADLIDRLARLRGAFADSAHWSPRIRLAPGETRRIDVALPDNLTRWRAVAWSAGGAEDFHVAEAAVEAGLAVEARLQAPVRLYPGDRARLAGSARQSGDAPARAEVALRATGAGVGAETATAIELAPRGQAAFTLGIAPDAPGRIDAVAAVRTPQGDDGVGGRIEVESTRIEGRRVQAGFVDADGVVLDVPAPPAGSESAHLHVDLMRGATGVVEQWTRDLRDYTHRCWEQMLSRAVGAALAMERGDPQWPEARAAVAEALDNVAVFQDEEGGFHYFADAMYLGHGDLRREIALTAWTVRALEQLGALGHAVPPEVLEAARRFLQKERLDRAPQDAVVAHAAFAAAAIDAPLAVRDALWTRWDALALPVRVATVRALERTRDARTPQAWTRLLAEAPRRGARRTLQARGEWPQWMASPLREQCGLIDLAARLAPADTRRELIAGLTDLYAGGVDSVDTQSAAVCLLALHDVGLGRDRAVAATLRTEAVETRLSIAPGADRTRWDAPGGTRSLRLASAGESVAFPGYVAELRWTEDARTARASAVGFDIERRYEVLRDGRWAPVTAGDVRESDWLRVTLVLTTSAPRHFVALTDAVPGGLQPTDLRLSGVGGLDLQALSDTGSGWFRTRRLDARTPKFYAQWLPAGRHEVHYFARAGHVGDYLAAPATAELMYGTASHARTAATRLAIDPAR